MGDRELRFISPQGTAINSMIRLTRRAAGYGGFMQPLQEGECPHFVRSVQANGQQIIIMMDTEDGEARNQGVLRGPNWVDGSFTSRRLVGRITAVRR